MLYSSIHLSCIWFTATENPVREYQAEPSFVKENWYYFIIVGVVIIAMCTCVSVTYYNCRKGKKPPQQVIMNMQPNSLYSRVADELRHSLSYDPRWEFPREK